jgi:ubiquinone biosynthesis protein
MFFQANLRRLLYIIFVVIGHALAHFTRGWLHRLPIIGKKLTSSQLNGPDRLRTVLEDLGGTFIKLGQMMSLQPDVLTFEYCNALYDLLDRVAPFEYEKVEQIIFSELGKSPQDIFESFSESPLATASIGQVHMARLKGRKIVVKIQRPEVDTDFMGDIRLMKTLLSLIKRTHLTALYWLVEPISEFVSWTQEELDYQNEARYMDRLRKDARSNIRERIPMVYWRFTTRRLLVMEYLDGITLIDYLREMDKDNQLLRQRLKEMDFEPNQFARNIIDNFLGDTFRYGLFHADLHPANLLILPNNTVGYVDFGITGVLSPYSRKELVSLTLAYTRGDLDGMCMAFFKVSALDEKSDVGGFRKGLQQFADDWYEARGDHRQLKKNFTLVMLDMLRLSKQTGIWPERDVIKYIRSAIASDGIITRFAPEFDVGAYLATSCERFLREAYTPPLSPEALVDWTVSSGNLVRDGATRLVSLLNHLTYMDTGTNQKMTSEAETQRITHLGIVVLAISILMTSSGEPVEFGLNLFTVEIGLLALAGSMLMSAIIKVR